MDSVCIGSRRRRRSPSPCGQRGHPRGVGMLARPSHVSRRWQHQPRDGAPVGGDALPARHVCGQHDARDSSDSSSPRRGTTMPTGELWTTASLPITGSGRRPWPENVRQALRRSTRATTTPASAPGVVVVGPRAGPSLSGTMPTDDWRRPRPVAPVDTAVTSVRPSGGFHGRPPLGTSLTITGQVPGPAQCSRTGPVELGRGLGGRPSSAPSSRGPAHLWTTPNRRPRCPSVVIVWSTVPLVEAGGERTGSYPQGPRRAVGGDLRGTSSATTDDRRLSCA